MAKQDFLVELGTEELPPKALKPLSDAFTRGITNGLEEAGIRFGKVEAFAAPRLTVTTITTTTRHGVIEVYIVAFVV